MSKIPFQFDISPSYFRKMGWFHPKKNPLHFKTLAFVTWCFSRCHSEKRKIVHNGKEIELDPYEFIFGRNVCSEETGLSDMEIRIQQKNMRNEGFLENVTSKTTNKYSVNRWVTSRFIENDIQQNIQQASSKHPAKQPQTRTKEPKKVKEQEQPQAPSFGTKMQHNVHNQTVSANADVVGSVVVFSCLSVVPLKQKDKEEISNAYREREVDVIRAVAVHQEYKGPIKSHKKFIIKALENNWQPNNQPSIALSPQAEINKYQIFKYRDSIIETLKLKDLKLVDMIDHVLFGHIKIFYESPVFGKDVGKARKHFNLLPQEEKKIDLKEVDEKILQFKQVSELSLKIAEN